MTNAITAPADVAYTSLMRLQTEYDQLTTEITEIQANMDTLLSPRQERAQAIMAEASMIAKSIYLGKMRDPEGKYSLSPTYKTKRTTKIDVDQLRVTHPEIYSRVKPYVTDNTAMDILEAANGGMEQVMELLRGIDADTYDKKAKIRIGDLEKVIGTPEREQLVSEGIIEDGIITVGEPRLCLIGFADALASQKRGRKAKPAGLGEGEDDE